MNDPDYVVDKITLMNERSTLNHHELKLTTPELDAGYALVIFIQRRQYFPLGLTFQQRWNKMESQMIIEDVHSVVIAMKESTSFAMLIKNWKLLSLDLGINDVCIDDLERKYNMGLLQPNEIPYEILKIWKAGAGTDATVKVLGDALLKCGLNDIEELLRKVFDKKEFSVKFMWHENMLTLDELLGRKIGTKIYERIMDKLTCYPSSTIIQLLKEKLTPPEKPTYYIPRTLSYRNQLNDEVFHHKLIENHIFLVKGISKHELARATGFQNVDVSGNQLDELTVRFIILECDDDFDMISRHTTNPVHLMEYKNQCYFWVKSNQSLESIAKFLRADAKHMNEDEMVNRVTASKTSTSFCISDSPGMGKTLVLANLARKIQQSNQNSIVLFIVLHEFFQQINYFSSNTSVVEAVAKYSSRNRLSKLVLKEMIRSDAYHLYLLLDGYDEISQDKIKMADSFLERVHMFENITAIVTTRPHLRHRLESIFNQLSYEILPFNDSNQVDFLTCYWIDQHGANKGPLLQTFAEKCLSVLQTKLTDKEREIAGIPLQCMMLAEVFAQVAVRSSKMQTESSAELSTISFFNMYKRLVELKFSRISKFSHDGSICELKKKYMDAHVREAIALLFPDWIDDFQPCFSGLDEIDNSSLYAVGLIETTPGTNTPRFIHRTFAEFILANFIVENIKEVIPCVHLLFEIILGQKGVFWDAATATDIPDHQYKLNFPVTATFLEMHFKYFLQHHSVEQVLPMNYLFTNINVDNLCWAILATVCADLENCFDLARYALSHIYQVNQLTSVGWTRWFQNLPLLVVKNSSNVSLIRKVLDLTDCRPECSYFIETQMLYYATPLHLAIRLGKYNIASYLIQTCRYNTRRLKFLLHACVEKSSNQTTSVIEDKLSIISMLVKSNPDCVKEVSLGCPPLLKSNIQLKLIQRLVEHGAGINASNDLGTVLHTSYDKNTYNDLVRLAFCYGFKAVNHVNKFGETPLMYFDFDDDELLNLFYKAGANFNAKDIWGNSVLFRALENSGSVDVVQKVLDYGADVNHINGRQENLAHIILKFGSDPDIIIRKLKIIKSRGFKSNLIHAKNSLGETPFYYAGLQHGEKVVAFFRRWKRKTFHCVIQ